MKKTITILIVYLVTIAGINSTCAQTKAETLQWLRSHLDTIVVHHKDSLLPYTMTKIYTFYEDAFVVKTVKDFIKDKSLNGTPAFSKVWYKDIFTKIDTAIIRGMNREEAGHEVYIYAVWAEHVYFIIGEENAPIKYWRTFNEPSGLDLYLPEDKAKSIEVIKRIMLLAKTDKEEDKSSLQAQAVASNPLQWLQQHQGALTYRVQSSEDGGYLEESFRFLPDKIVKRSALYGNEAQLLSADEQDWFYRDFQPVDDIRSLAIDTTNNGKLCKIWLRTRLALMNENEEIVGYAVFGFGFAPGDSAAKQTALQAIKAVMMLVEPENIPASKYPDDIRKDYTMLENTINRQKFPFPATMGYRITAELKDDSRLAISEFRPRSSQEYTLWLPGLDRFKLLLDTTGYNKEAVHFVLKMKDSVLVTTSVNNHREKHAKQPWATFTLENPHLIAEAETLLTNICRDNYRRKKWNEAKKLEETY